jgi:hypothetical protein
MSGLDHFANVMDIMRDGTKGDREMITNLLKAAIAVAVSPVAAIVDIVTLPASAFENKDAFHRTASLLESAGENVTRAVNPKD